MDEGTSGGDADITGGQGQYFPSALPTNPYTYGGSSGYTEDNVYADGNETVYFSNVKGSVGDLDIFER